MADRIYERAYTRWFDYGIPVEVVLCAHLGGRAFSYRVLVGKGRVAVRLDALGMHQNVVNFESDPENWDKDHTNRLHLLLEGLGCPSAEADEVVSDLCAYTQRLMEATRANPIVREARDYAERLAHEADKARKNRHVKWEATYDAVDAWFRMASVAAGPHMLQQWIENPPDGAST